MSQKNPTAVTPLYQQLAQRAGIKDHSKDNSWDYIMSLSEDVKTHFMNITAVVYQAQQILSEGNAYFGEARVLYEGIMRDVQEAATQWRANRDRHEGRTGFGNNPEETSTITDIGTSYIQIHEKLIVKTSYSAPRLQELVLQVETALKNSLPPEEVAAAASAIPQLNPAI